MAKSIAAACVAMQAAAEHLQGLLARPALAFPARPALEAVMAHAPPDAHATTAVRGLS
jgi:hypothetical protein